MICAKQVYILCPGRFFFFFPPRMKKCQLNENSGDHQKSPEFLAGFSVLFKYVAGLGTAYIYIKVVTVLMTCQWLTRLVTANFHCPLLTSPLTPNSWAICHFIQKSVWYSDGWPHRAACTVSLDQMSTKHETARQEKFQICLSTSLNCSVKSLDWIFLVCSSLSTVLYISTQKRKV